MKPFMGNPCGYYNCKYARCEFCGKYKPTCFGIRVPRWLGNILFRFEGWLLRPKNNKF